MGYVFLSYSSQNTTEASALRDMFEQSGVEVWMAERNIYGGENFASAIVPAIKECSCFVLLLTQETQESSWVGKEVERAVHYNKPIVPVQLTQVSLNEVFELYLSTSQIVTLPRIDINELKNRRLIQTVKDYISGKFKIAHPYKANTRSSGLKVIIPIVAALVLLIAVISSALFSHSSGDNSGENNSNNGSGNGQNSTATTPQPPSASDVDQIPEEYKDEVAMLKDTEPTIFINVGEYIVPTAAKSWDCYIYSEDSRIVVGDGRRIQGVSAGTTNIVVVNKQFASAVEAYRVTVGDPNAATKGVNQVPDNLAHYIDDFNNSQAGYQKLYTVSVRVGQDIVLNRLFTNSTLWSTDTGVTVATGEGSTVRGVSAGTAYVLLESDGLYSTYRVIVTE